MDQEKFYRNSYHFLNNLLKKPNLSIYQENFLLENFSGLEFAVPFYFIDYLPKKMNSPFYFEEFEINKDAKKDSKSYLNFKEYEAKFLKVILMLVCYSQQTYIESSYSGKDEDPLRYPFEIKSVKDFKLLRKLVKLTLQEQENTLISFPKERVLLCLNSPFVIIVCDASNEYMEFLQKIIQTEGLYMHG